MQINSEFNSSFANVDGVGIVIGRPNSQQNQQHIGVLFIDADLEPKFLHLAWHYDLRKDNPCPKYLWLDIPLDPINKIHLATVCALIFKSNQDGIPYGICIEGTGFAEDGSFTAEEQLSGLTCATFVIQVFHSQKLWIIDFEKWGFRGDDKLWQNNILDSLQNKAPADYINNQRQKIQKGAARFRPEEVAAAATLPNQPHGLDTLIEQSSEILKAVISHAEKIAAL